MRNTSTSSLFTKTKENSGTNNMKKGMVLPFEQYSITFDEIRYSIDMPPVIFILANLRFIQKAEKVYSFTF